MEAQISQGKSPVLPPRGARDPMASEKSRKRDSQSQSRTQSNERDGVVSVNQPSTEKQNQHLQECVYFISSDIVFSYNQNA